MGYTPDGIGGCLAEPGTCAINPFGYCLRIEVQSAKILERHVLSGARGTLSAVVYARAGVSDIATVTVDLSDFGGATETPLSLAEGIDAHTARYELSISTSGLESGLHGLEVSATSTSGQTHLGMAYLVVYSGSIRHVGAASLPTIQAAIDAATSGDLVLVPEGVFTGPGNTELHLDGKEIVLDSVSGPQSTFIDLQGTGSGFQLVNSRETERTVISGLTIVRANTSAVRLVTTGPDVSVTPTLFDLHLQSNTSMDEGGALRVAGNGAGARIVSVIFDGNGWLSQTGEGGALYVGKDAYAYVEDSVFTGNQAGYGGAISGDPGSYFEVYRSEFRANQSGQKGGAIYGDWAMLGQCFFDDNTAAFEGGAVYIYSMAHFEGCSFDGNASAGLTSAGGAIYGRGSLTVEGSGLRRNDAKHNAGAIYAGGSLAVSGSVLLYNTATDSGGAIMLRKGGDISLSIFHANAVTTSNTSYGNGGALYIDAQALSPARVSQSTFTSNSSTRSGGAIRGTWVTVEESTFRNNSASAYGGALYFWSGDNVVRGTRIEKNHATLHGGGIYVSSSSAPTLLVEDSEVIENTADGSGGGINAYRTESLTVLGSLFQNNEAGYRSNGYGGALRCYEVTTFCRIESSILRGNRANYGGALRTNDTRLELWNVLVDHNTSRTSGGGLHINNLNGAKAIIESSTFSHNGSLVRGGGVYLYNGVLDLRDSIVFDNTAGQNAASAELYVSKTPAANVATVSYCDIHKDGISDLGRHINDGNGFFPGQEGNLSIDPQFADPDAWDFSLLASSPCLDVGSQDASEALLDGLSARADGLLDDGLLDLGYHR
jgi:predicted outer membrane repeat protein